MTLLQYYLLWNIGKGTELNCKETSTISSSTPTQVAINPWLDKDGLAHAFMLFNMKSQVTRQFLDIVDETAKEFVHRLMTKRPKTLETLCDTISLLPTTPCLNTFVGMLQDTAAVERLFFMLKSKANGMPLQITINLHQNQLTIQPTKSLLVTIVTYALNHA